MSTADSQPRPVTFRLEAIATTSALSRIVTTLHTRQADVRGLDWSSAGVTGSDSPRAVITIELLLDRQGQLRMREYLARLVDVTSVKTVAALDAPAL